jgi:hypothetical protein
MFAVLSGYFAGKITPRRRMQRVILCHQRTPVAHPQKKPTWRTTLWVFHHVGLLINGPVAAATCPSFSHPTSISIIGLQQPYCRLHHPLRNSKTMTTMIKINPSVPPPIQIKSLKDA